MPSFLGILKGVGKGIKTAAPVIGPAISVFNPAAGSLFNTVIGSMTKAEDAFSEVERAGPRKKEMVTAEFESGLHIAAEILAMNGHQLQYDVQALSEFIDAQSHALNCLAKLKASMKIAQPAQVQPAAYTSFGASAGK